MPTTAPPPPAAVPPTATPPPGSPWQAPPPAPAAAVRANRPREHWNWAAGAVVAQLVVLAALTTSTWATRSLAGALPDTDDITVSAIILTGATGIAVLATILLAGRSAVAPATFALLAGLAGTVGYLWQVLNNWTSFMDSLWEVQVSTLALAAVPVIIGVVALGLRRLAKPLAVR